MKRIASRVALLASLCAMISACGNAVSPQGDGAVMRADATAESSVDSAAGCLLPNGATCPFGQSCPAGDGCNTCFCMPGQMFAGCTLIGCLRSCNERSPCAANEECVYPVSGCGMDGACSPITDCAATASFCGCDGNTFQSCPNRPTSPSARPGACLTPVMDAGVACAGAALNAQGACVFVTGTRASVECCRGYNCSGNAVCAMVPPTCAAGTVPTVVGGCWGPCVPRELCR